MVRGSTTNDRPVWRLDHARWVLVPAAVSLVGWLTLLPGELLASLLFAVVEGALGVWIAFVVFVFITRERGSAFNFLGRFGAHVALGVAAWLTVAFLPRTWYVSQLVDWRLALHAPSSEETLVELFDDPISSSRRSFVRAESYDAEGRARVVFADEVFDLPPRADTEQSLAYYCPAHDDWYYVVRWAR
jgi:hypothetical protein